MPARVQRPPQRTAHCPSCRTTRTVKTLGTATVSGYRRHIYECQAADCGLTWLPPHIHLTTAA